MPKCILPKCPFLFGAVVLVGFLDVVSGLGVDDRPGGAGEWGFRPAEDATVAVSPPGFSWRPQKNARGYELQVARDAGFADSAYQCDDIEWNVHCPSIVLAPGRYWWRFRFRDADGAISEWSRVRAFSVPEGAMALPLPARADLMARIPKEHPRLWVRPEQLPGLRKKAQAEMSEAFSKLQAKCDALLADPPPTEEPPKYPAGTTRGSDPWRKIWWGNRTYTQRALDGAATLAFAHRLGGKPEYGQLARTLLLECAKWDPKGATGYRYNDEAGMPYNTYFSRAYTFVNDLLLDDEKELCRKVMAIRGDEMFRHLCPRHIWRPYASHSNRAWHFLGEIGIAFLGEIPEAETWVWFAANVFACVYPVWCDDDGGWHEGMAYWRSYIGRFTWWADIMHTAMGINAYDKPYFSRIGDYAMYLQPPGTQGGGFGDLTARLESRGNASLLRIFAAQARNPYWQWYADAHGDAGVPGGYIGFVRGAMPSVPAESPTGLPSSKCFQGVGLAILNTNLVSAEKNVQVIFKSSPFGTQSHGYESNNAFLLYAFGERLFIRTGRRDSYGSAHHKKWMWETKSVNSITVNGDGQRGHSSTACGEITDFFTSSEVDYVEGEASGAYAGKLKEFRRRILFIKPAAVLIYDSLRSEKPSSFEWLLHSPVPMTMTSQSDVRIENGDAACQASLLWPEKLNISVTDAFETPPRPRIKLTEYHLTAVTPELAEVQQFVTVFRPHRSDVSLSGQPEVMKENEALRVTIPLAGGSVADVCLQLSGTQSKGEILAGDARIEAVVRDGTGGVVLRFAR